MPTPVGAPTNTGNPERLRMFFREGTQLGVFFLTAESDR